MTAIQLINAAADLGQRWHLTKRGKIRNQKCKCPIIAVFEAKCKGRTGRAEYAPFIGYKHLGMDLCEAGAAIKAADNAPKAKYRGLMLRKLVGAKCVRKRKN